MITQTIGCAIQVHRTLGPGYTEAVYHDALAIELELAHVPFEREFPVTVSYREHALRQHRLDLVVGHAVVVELKAVERLERIHQAQLLSHMKASGMQAGLLMNFHSEFLRSQLRRFVL